jgi:hypothetical protein
MMSKSAHRQIIRFVVSSVVIVFTLSLPLAHSNAQPVSGSASPSPRIEQISDVPPNTGLSLTLSPVFLNLTAYTGKIVKSTIKLTNNNTFAERYKLSVIKFQPDAKGETIVPIQDTAGDETLRWIQIAEPEVVVQGKSSKVVAFDVQVPEYAFLGYYFGISVQRAKEQFARTDTTKIVGQAIMPIMLDVVRGGDKGPLFVDGDSNIYKRAILESVTTSSWWYEYLPVEFEIKFKNTGKVHLAPFGNIVIQQGDVELGTLQVNESGNNTLPGVMRTYKSEWNDGFIVREPVKKGSDFVMDKDGNKIYHTVIKWDSLTKMRIGKYTAKAIVVYNNGRNDVPLEALVSFWIIPWKIILVITLVLALLIFGIKSAVTNLIR